MQILTELLGLRQEHITTGNSYHSRIFFVCFGGEPISWPVMVSQNMFVAEYERFKFFFTSLSVAIRGAHRPNGRESSGCRESSRLLYN